MPTGPADMWCWGLRGQRPSVPGLQDWHAVGSLLPGHPLWQQHKLWARRRGGQKTYKQWKWPRRCGKIAGPQGSRDSHLVLCRAPFQVGGGSLHVRDGAKTEPGQRAADAAGWAWGDCGRSHKCTILFGTKGVIRDHRWFQIFFASG